MKIAVLGGGISGLSIARMLNDRGFDVTLYEKNDTVGGLARTRYTDGILYDPHGAHVFNSKIPEVMEWAFSIMDKDKWRYTVRNAKIYFNGRYVSYPFELSLCELDKNDAVNCVYDFMMAQEGDEPDNFKDWLIWNFGQSICDYYMIPYNEKIWSYPLDKMETKWMQGKMPLPSKKEILQSVLLEDSTERKMPHSTFYYPLDGGIQSFMDSIANGINIYCNSVVDSIENKNGKWIINYEDSYDEVISTIPLPELKGLMELPKNVVDAIKDLKYNSLTTVLFECDNTDISWLYVPSHDYKSHRVGYQSSVTPNANKCHDCGAAALEIIGEKFDVSTLDSENNVLPKELGYTKTLDSEFTKYAYVIYDKNYRKNMETILNYFNNVSGFYLHGRWGNWNYKNMDLCIYDSMLLVKKILKEIDKK